MQMKITERKGKEKPHNKSFMAKRIATYPGI